MGRILSEPLNILGSLGLTLLRMLDWTRALIVLAIARVEHRYGENCSMYAIGVTGTGYGSWLMNLWPHHTCSSGVTGV